MLYDFHVHDAIRVEYRVRTDGPAFPRGWSRIEEEVRTPGGNGVVCAVALAKWGAKVLLSGNPIGDDRHGQFLREELEKIPNLTFDAEIQNGFATPYAILMKAGAKDVGTMLSPSAGPIPVQRRPKDLAVARFFWGDAGVWGAGETHLAPFSQDYRGLTTNLDGVAMVYLNLMAPDLDSDARAQFLRALETTYHQKFGAIDTLPTLEQLEAVLNGSV